jgi:hypothetical protein
MLISMLVELNVQALRHLLLMRPVLLAQLTNLSLIYKLKTVQHVLMELLLIILLINVFKVLLNLMLLLEQLKFS